jgi:hypothetical protein
MRLLTLTGIGVLSLLLGIPAVSAQDDPKPRQDEPKQEEPKAEPGHQDEAKPEKQNEVKPPKDETKKDENKQEKQQEKEQQKQEEKATHNAAKPSGQAGTPVSKSGHIPDNQFHAHFGHQHTFVVNEPIIVAGQPRFQYGGYWFVISQPWPVGWTYSDECYIDYVDGEYILFDLLHPGVQVVLFVVM